MSTKKNYTVWFEIYGKRMKTTVLATDEENAKKLVIDKLVINKVELKKDDVFNDAIDILDNMSNYLGGLKKS